MTSRALTLLILLFSAVGLLAAGVLSYGHLAGVEVPCGASSAGCKTVQAHPSSHWFGIPVAYFGVLAYLGLLTITVLRHFGWGPSPRLLLKVGLLVSGVGAIASLALQVYSFAVIRAQCNWCLVSAGAMCLLFVLHGIQFQRADGALEESPAKGKADLGLAGLLTVGAIVGIWLFAMQSKGSGGTVLDPARLKEDMFVLLPRGAPSVGPADAPITIVEFGDLFCPMCRSTFQHMRKLQSQHRNKVRWVFRHFPLYMKEEHRLALPSAVVAEHAERNGKFWEFVGKLYEADLATLKTMEDIYLLLESVNVDRAGAETALNNDDSPELKRVAEDMKLANLLGIQETPTFVWLVEGEPPTAMRKADLDEKMKTAKVQALLRE